MKFNEKIIKTEIIENYRKENNLTKKDFCKLCKIGTHTYQRLLTNQNFNITALIKIANVMNIHACKLFES